MAEPGESQASEVKAPDASVNLVELFQAGENKIERRRTENLFKQLDERQLTEDEQSIIQQRVELQRKMFQEYERREKQRKMRELQEVCPDLDEEAARRALELCNWKEEVAAEKVAADPAFLKRVRSGAVSHFEHAPAPKPERQRSSGSRQATVGPRPRLVDPSQVGAVFVGRFKSRLGPHQISAMGRQQQQQATAGTSTARRAGQAGAAAAAATTGEGQAAAPSARSTRGRQGQQTGSASAAAPAADADADTDAGPSDVPPAVAEVGAGTVGGDAPEEAEAMGTEHAGGEERGAEEAEGGEGDGTDHDDEEEGDEAMEDPNSADMSDNELQYEDDVLPVMSPLANKKQRRPEDDGMQDEDTGGGAPQAVPGQSPLFKYRLVAETSTGAVHSVATEEWNSVLRAAQQQQHQQGQGQQLAHAQAHEHPHAHAPNQRGQEDGVVEMMVEGGQAAGQQAAAGTGRERAAGRQGGGTPVGGVKGTGGGSGTPDDDEVSSPATGLPIDSDNRHGTQRNISHRPNRQSAAPQSGQKAAPGPAPAPQQQEQEQQPAVAAEGPAATGAAAAATAEGPVRPRRAAAEIAAVLRQVDRAGGRAAGRGGRGAGRGRGAAAAATYGDDGDDEGASSGGETGDDGDDSDFEVEAGRAGRSGAAAGGAAAAVDEEATTSDDGEDWVDTEDDSDCFVAPGSRKRRAGGGGGGGASRRPQRQRKRAASGGSGGGAQATGGRGLARQRPTAAAAAVAAAGGAGDVGAAPQAAQGTEVGADGSGGEGAPGPSGQHPAAGAANAAAPAAGRGNGGGGEDSEATVTEDESPGGKGKRPTKGRKGRATSGGSGRGGKGGGAAGAGAGGGAAISASGHTCRGRVKQKGVKRADLLAVGTLVPRQGWYNAGYIFPAGFKAQTLFRSSVDLDSLTLHTCEILGETGQYWPAPTFVVTAADRPDEPLVAKSCTGCWTAVLRRINSEIEGRRAAGEDLPPPPKTAIAGPEYFGLNQPEICAAIEALDEERKCATYWDGKMDREAARGGQPVASRGRTSAGSGAGAASGGAAAAAAPAAAPRQSRPPRTSTGGGGGGGGRSRRGGGRGRGSGDEEEMAAPAAEGEEDPEETYAGNRWSAVTRAERYRKRCEEAGEDMASLLEASNRDNPLPGFLDPITLEPVVNPAISPYGHVMGLATWKAVLAEHGRCPFTKQPLKPEALTVLTKLNIERYRSRMIEG